MKKILTSHEKDGEITKEDIEGFLNELGSFPSDEEIVRKIELVDHDGMYNVPGAEVSNEKEWVCARSGYPFHLCESQQLGSQKHENRKTSPS